MVQRGEQTRFARESPQPLRIVAECSWKNLDGNVSTERCVPGTIDFAHRAGADLRLHFVDADAYPREGGLGVHQRRRWYIVSGHGVG